MCLKIGRTWALATAGIALLVGDPRCSCNFRHIVASMRACHN